MTPAQYATALTTLSLTPDQAAIWLGIGRSTAYRYLKTGCEGAVERALGMAVEIKDAKMLLKLKIANAALEYAPIDRSEKFSDRVKNLAEISEDAANDIIDVTLAALRLPPVRHSDLTAAVGLPVSAEPPTP